MKRIMSVLLAVVLAASCLTLAGCGKKEAETIKIGAIGPLTGETQLWGQVLCEAVIMTAEEINAAGGLCGKQIEVIKYDSRDDAVETTNAARKAIQNDGVVAFVGTESSTSTLALAEVCEEYGVPFVCTQATNIKITINEGDGSTRPYSFRSGLNDYQCGSAIAEYATAELGCQRAAIIYNVGNDFSMGLRMAFTEAFESNGGEVVVDGAFNNGDVDFRAVLTKIKESGIDFDTFYIASGYYKEVGLICNQMVELGMSGYTMLTTDAQQAPVIYEIAGDNCEGMYYPTLVDAYNEDAKAFVAAYMERWGWDPIENTVGDVFTARDAATMIFTAIKNMNSYEPESIRKGLEDIGTLEGSTGPLTVIPETHSVLRIVPVYKVVSQVSEEVAKFMPTT